MDPLKIDDKFASEAFAEEPVLEPQPRRTKRVVIVHEFDSHIFDRIKHALRTAGEHFEENAKTMDQNTAAGGSAFVHARASERLAKEFREYVRECRAVVDLLEEHDRLIVAEWPEE